MATGKMPYYTGTTNEDYGPSITSGEFDKTIYDWGKAIDDSWHTLSNAEWNYIFAGRANCSSLYGFQTKVSAHRCTPEPLCSAAYNTSFLH